MRRHSGTGALGRVGAMENEDINPLDGVANLADVMLVLACGIMLALITYWNVDITMTANNPVEVEPGAELTEMEGLDSQDGTPIEGSGLEEYGKVYRDADGNYYMTVTGQETAAP
ncbi:MAG: DUF2149 domain-containing protein [Oscillospiraceae bacterium]|nr:DUF2149 domain-containing protein [Oscillospiraceae bacterium]